MTPRERQHDGPHRRKSALKKNIEIYIACLAQLSDFADFKGSYWCLKENARRHPKLEQLLIDKLLELANSQLFIIKLI